MLRFTGLFIIGLARKRDVFMTDLLASLNSPQQEAVTTTEGPLLVLAGAGSGKTKMLTSRIAYLIQTGRARAHEILAVTFTNKAAREMRERVVRILDGTGFAPYDMGTFHSICAKILRKEAAYLPFTKPFVIYDDSDQHTLIKSIVKAKNWDEKLYSPKAFQYAINRLKCDAREPGDPFAQVSRMIERKFPELWEAYHRAMIDNNAIDFGEMITMTYRLLRDHEDVRAFYQRRYKYILVDEYQDTNRAQYLLLSHLAKPEFGGRGNICVVGDEDQSIYGWRGADIKNILDFEKDYPSAKVVKLEQNYRSTQTIVNAASHVIANNLERKNKTLYSRESIGDPIIRLQCPDDRFEAEQVVKEIQAQLAEHHDLSFHDFAILYRTHAQSRLFEEFLRQAKLPYKIVGGLRFFDRKEIKDVMAYLKLVLNPDDSVSFRRIINVPARGIGKTTLDKLEAAWGQKGSLWTFFCKEMDQPTLFAGKTLKKLQQFRDMIERWMTEVAVMSVVDLYHKIIDETNYIGDLRNEGSDESHERIENLEEFNTVILEFEERTEDPVGKLTDFLESVSLADAPETDGQQSSIQLMTFHGCKGLEFPMVFMVGCEEGLFPSVKGDDDRVIERELEEERRLCYVGMTRARRLLYMSHAAFRRVWGNMLYQYPARFFNEIPANLVQVRDHGREYSTDRVRSI